VQARPHIPTVDARTLKEWLAQGRALHLLDVRTPEEFAAWRIPTSQNLPLERLLAGEGVNSIPRDRAVVTICAHGTRARQAAEHLSRTSWTPTSTPTTSPARGGYRRKPAQPSI